MPAKSFFSNSLSTVFTVCWDYRCTEQRCQLIQKMLTLTMAMQKSFVRWEGEKVHVVYIVLSFHCLRVHRSPSTFESVSWCFLIP